MSDNVKIVRLITGEDVLCECTQDQHGFLLLKNPALLVPAGSGKLGLVPWMPYADVESGVSVNSDRVVFTLNPHPELKNQYQSAITGLVLPTVGEVAAATNSAKKLKLSTD